VANPQVTVNGTVTYSVTITDATGCSGTDVAQVSVNQPPIIGTLTQDALCAQSCDGEASALVVGGTQPYNAFTWTDAQGTIVQTGPVNSLNGLCAGTYTLVVTDNANCSDTTTFAIAEPTALNLTLGTQPSTCGASNGSVVATTTGGTGAYSFSWTPSGNNDTLSNIPAGDYTVTVTDANNCSATATATVTTTSSITISGTATNVECFGGATGSIATTVTPAGGTITYVWSGNATGANPTGLTAGTYIVTATDANGCSATDTIVVNDGIVVSVDAGFDQTINDGDTVTLTANSVQLGLYTWTGPNGFSESGISVSDIPGLPSNTYTVVLSVGNCTGSDTVNVQVIFGAGLAMPNAFTPNGDNRNDVLLPLVSPGNDIIFFQVYNRWGTRVYDLNDNNGLGWDGSFNGEPQPRDAYIWIVRTRNGNGFEQELNGDVTLIR
jgi:gliding motility-associated-like protein